MTEPMATLFPGRKAKGKQKGGEFGASIAKTCFFGEPCSHWNMPVKNAQNENFLFLNCVLCLCNPASLNYLWHMYKNAS